jgi:hypothetical protein
MNLFTPRDLRQLSQTLKDRFIEPTEIVSVDTDLIDQIGYDVVFGYALVDRYREALDWCCSRWNKLNNGNDRWSTPEFFRVRFSNPQDRLMFMLRWG